MADRADIARLKSGWLGRQPATFQSALIADVTWRHADVGTTINLAGEEVGGIWGIAKGQIDIVSAIGVAESPIADIHLPGTWGGMAPLYGRARVSNGTVRVPALVASVPLIRLKSLLSSHPEWWECIGQLTMEFAVRYGGATGDLLIRNSRQRVIAVLLRLADCRQCDPVTPPTIILSHNDLAAAANMSRHLAGETLRELADQQLIELGYRQVTIIKAAALRALVDA